MTPEEQFRQFAWPLKIFVGAVGVAVAGIGAIGVMALFGMMLEGISQNIEQRDICQKHAATPYEYHQCQ